MKKSFIFFIGIFLLLFVNLVSASDIAYIYKSTGAIDENVVDIFEEFGFSIELINENNLPLTFSNYKFVFIGDERFRNDDRIKIWEFPAIVSNYYFGEEWGLTDSDGVSKLAANSPLRVRKDDEIIQVYTQATFDSSTVGIPYYYLADENRDNDLAKITSPYLNNGERLGAVTSHGDAGITLSNGQTTSDNICFFGIIESDYWTDEARELFKECVEFVGMVCKKENDCPNDEVSEPFCKGKDVYKNIKKFMCENPGTFNSQCVDNKEEKFVKSCSSSCSNGKCVCLDKDKDIFDECEIGDEGDDGKKIDCNDNNTNINPGADEICNGIDDDCDNLIDEKSNICGQGNICLSGGCVKIACSKESDCGNDGFIDGVFCDGSGNKDLYQNYLNFTCENPGTISSSCTKETESRLVTDCKDSCSQGMCVSFVCNNNLDCEDNNNFTKDVCVNPGTLESRCSHETIACLTNNDCKDNNAHTLDICNNPGKTNSFCSYQDIICLSDSDCGTDGFVGNLFCQGQGNNDVYQNFVEFSCENPGTAGSSCTQTVSSLLVNECSDFCSDGVCIDVVCNNNLDCNDNNENTIDVCVAPGKIDSHCSHEEVACVSNSDCGINRFTGELFCQGKDLYRNFINFSCNNAGTEQSFCSNNVNANFISSCTYACSSGECIRCNNNLDCNDNNENTVDVCRFGGSSDSFCDYKTITCNKNSDCGTDKFIDGEFCSNNGVFKNFKTFMCLNQGTTNSSCTSEIEPKLIQQCTLNQTCSSGMCLEVMCKKDSDCGEDQFIGDKFCKEGDVFQNFKVFSCINSGGQNSKCLSQIDPIIIEQCEFGCSNGKCVEQIKCSKDSDCGNDGFVGGPFCEEGNAHKNFNDYTCLNPGTSASSCKLETTSVVVEDCNGGEVCSNGMCVDVVCNKDSDCNDNNPLTLDKCINPGTSASKCANTPINCASDIDCGIDGFIGDEMCSVNDVVKNFQDAECHNSGTTESFCTLEVTPKSVDQCEFACIENGVCIRCDENSDCDDNDSDTKDICVNPGTKESFCKNEKEDICDAKLMVQFDYIKNKKNGNLEPRVFVGENKIEFGDKEMIPLMKNGEFIKDSDYVEDVPGIALQRVGDGKLKFILFGNHKEGKGKEILAAKLKFEDAFVTGFKNQKDVPHKKVDNQGNGKYKLGEPREDEVYIDKKDKEILWFSTVHTGSDGFFLDLECETS